MKNTPPKTNIEPENHLFEKENHLPNLHLRFHVGFLWCIHKMQTLNTNLITLPAPSAFQVLQFPASSCSSPYSIDAEISLDITVVNQIPSLKLT